MRRRRKRVSSEGHERWLVSYADFITLLFAFFVVMYASSQVDKRRIGRLALAIQSAFDSMGAFPPSNAQAPLNFARASPFDELHGKPVDPVILANAEIEMQQMQAIADETANLRVLRKELEGALATQVKHNEVAIRETSDGLVISLREMGFFDSGSAKIKSGSLAALSKIAGILLSRNYRIRIEGYTDNIPVHNKQFASNWELSTTRATEIVRLLITKYGFPPDRLSAAGYAQYHPVASNASEEGRAQNRRVDVVVLRNNLGLVPGSRP